MRVGRVVAVVVAVVLGGVSVVLAGAGVAAASNRPVVSVSVGELVGASAPVTYSVNRGAHQVASVTYSLNGSPAVPAPLPTDTGRRSSSETFTVVPQPGMNTVIVTVWLSDGGSVVSAPVTFSYGGGFARAGCFETGTPGLYVVTDGSNPEVLTFSSAYNAYLFTASFDPACVSTFDATTSSPAYVWAGDEAAALALCEPFGTTWVSPQHQEHLYACLP